MRALAALAGTIAVAAAQPTYTLQRSITGNAFFGDAFTFYASYDPTQGYVEYVDQATAEQLGMINASYVTETGKARWGVDTTQVLNPNANLGRASIRLQSTETYSHGLFVLDLAHMPANQCGVWPAFWSMGSGVWPESGEIDILETTNNVGNNAMTLHTSPGCTIAGTGQTGTLLTNDCSVGDSYTGCASSATQPNNAGHELNAAGGGVYAMLRTTTGIQIWFFARSQIPASLADGGQRPDVTEFGTPAANFEGSCDFDAHFQGHTLIFDTDFCGSWAGNTWQIDGCPMLDPSNGWQSCNDFVAANPAAFVETYWEINHLNVYQLASPPTDSTTTLTSSRIPVASTSSIATLTSNAQGRSSTLFGEPTTFTTHISNIANVQDRRITSDDDSTWSPPTPFVTGQPGSSGSESAPYSPTYTHQFTPDLNAPTAFPPHHHGCGVLPYLCPEELEERPNSLELPNSLYKIANAFKNLLARVAQQDTVGHQREPVSPGEVVDHHVGRPDPHEACYPFGSNCGAATVSVSEEITDADANESLNAMAHEMPVEVTEHNIAHINPQPCCPLGVACGVGSEERDEASGKNAAPDTIETINDSDSRMPLEIVEHDVAQIQPQACYPPGATCGSGSKERDEASAETMARDDDDFVRDHEGKMPLEVEERGIGHFGPNQACYPPGSTCGQGERKRDADSADEATDGGDSDLGEHDRLVPLETVEHFIPKTPWPCYPPGVACEIGQPTQRDEASADEAATAGGEELEESVALGIFKRILPHRPWSCYPPGAACDVSPEERDVAAIAEQSHADGGVAFDKREELVTVDTVDPDIIGRPWSCYPPGAACDINHSERDEASLTEAGHAYDDAAFDRRDVSVRSDTVDPDVIGRPWSCYPPGAACDVSPHERDEALTAESSNFDGDAVAKHEDPVLPGTVNPDVIGRPWSCYPPGAACDVSPNQPRQTESVDVGHEKQGNVQDHREQAMPLEVVEREVELPNPQSCTYPGFTCGIISVGEAQSDTVGISVDDGGPFHHSHHAHSFPLPTIALEAMWPASTATAPNDVQARQATQSAGMCQILGGCRNYQVGRGIVPTTTDPLAPSNTEVTPLASNAKASAVDHVMAGSTAVHANGGVGLAVGYGMVVNLVTLATAVVAAVVL